MEGNSVQISWETMADDVERLVLELVRAGKIAAGQIIVIGASTSEIIGQHIGTAGSARAAAQIFLGVERVRQQIGFYAAFQCCEHLNRALAVERELLLHYPMLEQVTAIPVAHAGGSMAAYAFTQMQQPILVETIQAHGAIDIGQTLIGMHLRKVAVPLRPSLQQIGCAQVVMAYTRPKLIGGARAVYTN